MEAFIERTFELGEAASVVVRFARPEGDGGDFRCDYEIVWPDRISSARAWGVDAVQALTLAMQNAHVRLLASDAAKSGQLRWLGSTDLGLPLPKSVTPEEFK